MEADIKKSCYVEHRIRKVYYRKLKVYFKEALVPIEEDDDVRELVVYGKTTY